jgi:alpha-galactosidase
LRYLPAGRGFGKSVLAQCCAIAWGGSSLSGVLLSHGTLGVAPGTDLRLQFYALDQGQELLAQGAAEPLVAGLECPLQLECRPETFRLETGQVASALGRAVCHWASADFGPAPGEAAAVLLRQTVRIEFYPQWPGSAILHWQFKNLDSQEIIFERLACPALHLDLAWASRQLWTLQGVAVHWGQDFAFPMPDRFQRDNDLGHRDGGEGGGIPLVDFWNDRAGLSLAHVAPFQALWHLPVSASPEGIRLALEDRRAVRLAPGQRLDGLPVLLTVHRGDFFAPLERYRQVLAAQGVTPAVPNAEDYQPAWCSWGYEFDVRPQEVFGVLPALDDLGLRWLTLDDRWFDHYSDWNPRSDTFPGGEAQMRQMVDRIHADGRYAQLWWYPLAVEDGIGHWDKHTYGYSQILQQHPDWLCLNADGSVARNNRGLAILCPALPQVQQYIQAQTLRFIRDWDFDGHKLDNIYTVPPCYNPAHHHQRPEEAVEAFPEIYRLIFTTTRALKPYSVTQICPCGTPPTHTLLPYMDQAVTADPTSSAQIRQRIKFYKALLGRRAAVFADHVELSDGGHDFASEIGAGGVPSTKFVWPEDPALRQRLAEWWGLDDAKQLLWKEWFRRYAQTPLAQGEYLNLYDMGFDFPEAHAIRLNDRMYYAFYTPLGEPSFQGRVELRGLGPGNYQVFDYVGRQRLGSVQGALAFLDVAFEHALLLEVTPTGDGITIPAHRMDTILLNHLGAAEQNPNLLLN